MEVSGEESSADEVPEEILLNSSSDSVASTKPITTYSEAANHNCDTKPITTDSEAANPKCDTKPITTDSEAGTGNSSTVPITPDSEAKNSGAASAEFRPSVPSRGDTHTDMEESAAPPQMNIPGEYYAIQNARRLQRTMPNINGGYPAAPTMPGSFFMPGDNRENIAHVTFDIEANQCVSTSYNSVEMSCHCCGTFMGSPGDTSSGRQTFVLADQNFPAALPSDNSGAKCLKILRVEGANLGELADKFISLTKNWEVPAGSLVLIASLSHLAEVGLAAYTEDLAAAVSKLAVSFKKNVNIAPAPFVLCDDTADAHLIRAIVELYAWFSTTMKQTAGMSISAFQMSLEGLNYGATGEQQPDFETRHRLPDGLDSKKKKIWSSSGLATLPTGVKKFAKDVEAEIIGKLLADLDAFLALDLQLQPSLERDVVRADMVAKDNTTYILVGGSNALRTANGIARAGSKAIAATIPGWRPTESLTGQIIRKIEKAIGMCASKNDVVIVYQMHDNCNYFVRGDDGSLVPAKKDAAGHYHVNGASAFAPKDSQYVAFKHTLPVLEAISGVRKIILGPLPRYWSFPCCKTGRHCTNMKEQDYHKNLEQAIYDGKNNLKAFCFRHGLRETRIVSSWQLVKGLDDVWADPVHLRDKGYDALADGIICAAGELRRKRAASTSAAAGTPPAKKPRYTDRRSNNSWGNPVDYQQSEDSNRGRSYPVAVYQREREHAQRQWERLPYPQHAGMGNERSRSHNRGRRGGYRY